MMSNCRNVYFFFFVKNGGLRIGKLIFRAKQNISRNIVHDQIIQIVINFIQQLTYSKEIDFHYSIVSPIIITLIKILTFANSSSITCKYKKSWQSQNRFTVLELLSHKYTTSTLPILLPVYIEAFHEY